MTDDAGEVLIVEDDGAIRNLLAAALRREGLRVTTAIDGIEGVAALRNRPYRVVLLDLRMPRMNGWDVVDWLREQPSAKPRTLIVTTADGQRVVDDLDPALVNAMVFKPFDIHELTAYVKACCIACIEADRRRRRMIGAGV
jgi:DNA-binding response OmpR family regulator